MGYREGTVGKVIQGGDYGGKRYREGTAGKEMRGEECGDRDTGMGVRRELLEQECREWHRGMIQHSFHVTSLTTKTLVIPP